MIRVRMAIFVALLVVVLGPAVNPISAQTNLWNNFSGTNDWNVPGNWTNNFSPVSGAGTALQFTNDVAGGAYGATNGFTSPFILTQLIFSNANVSGGTITIGGNSLAFTNNTGNTVPATIFQDGAGAVVLNNNVLLGANLTVAGGGSGTLTINGSISGSGGLTMNNPSLLVLAANNTYTGTTIVSNGTLQAGIANAIANSSGLNVTLVNGISTGQFDLAGFNQQILSLAGNGFITNSSSGTTATLTVSNGTANTATFGGVLAGNLALTKAGNSSSLILTNLNNSYTGLTTISGGTLWDGTFTASGGVAGNFIPGGVNLISGTFAVPQNTAIADLSGNSGASVNGEGQNKTLTFGGDGSNTTYAGNFAGLGGLTKVGTGTTILSGTGGPSTLNINGGEIQLANNVFPSGLALTFGGSSGATYDLNGFNETLSILYNGVAAGSTYLFSTEAGTASVSSVFFEGTETGSGSATGMITGNIAFSSTSLDIRNNGAATALLIFNGPISGTGGITPGGNTSGTIEFEGNSSNTLSGTWNLGHGTILLNKSNGAVAVNGNVNITGSTVTLLQPNQIASWATVTLNTQGSFNLNGQNQTLASIVMSGAGFTLAGGGTLTLSTNGTGTAIMLTVGENIADNLGVNIALTGASGGNDIFITNTTTAAIGAQQSVVTIGGAVGQYTLDLGTVNRTITVASNNDLSGPANNATITSIITDTGGLIKQGSGLLQLAAANTFSGNTVISNGTLLLANNLALQNSAFDPSGAGVLSFAGGVTTPVFGGLVNGGTLTLPGSVTRLTLNVAAGVTDTFSGVLSGTAGLTSTGMGTQVFSGINLYTGPTIVSNGTFLVDGSLNLSSAVTVFGGILGGTGSVGRVTVASGGTLAPGSPVGTFTVTNLTLNGTMAITLTNDSISLLNASAGNLVLSNATIAFTITGTQSATAYVFAAYAPNGLTTNNVTVTGLGADTIAWDYENLNEIAVVIPEPSTTLLLLFGLGGLAAVARRRR